MTFEIRNFVRKNLGDVRMSYLISLIALFGFLLGCQWKKGGDLEEMYRNANKSRIHGDYPAAVTDYSRLIDNDSTKGDYFFYRAICLTQMAEFDLAIFDFEKSIALNNKLADCYYSLAVIYIHEFPNEKLANDCIVKFGEQNPDSESLIELSTAFIDKFINNSPESGIDL